MNDYKLKYSYGSKGKRGTKGDKGCSGIIGNYGDCGIQGISGVKGIKGDTGDYGPHGSKGEEGNVGIKGNVGSATDGIKGQKGEKGIHMISVIELDNSTIIQYNDSSVFEFNNNSLKGTSGNKGDQGISGINGIPGLVGEQGSKGEKGNMGEKGLIGESVVAFSQQYSSNTFTVDLIGESGLNGEQGTVGNSISSFINYLRYGFKLCGNTAVIYNASQSNDEEFYLPKFSESFISDSASANITNFYVDTSESERFISASSIFKKYLDQKIVGLYNATVSEGEGEFEVLAGSIDSISPIDNSFYNSLDVDSYFSRGLIVKSQGNQKYNRNTIVEGISVNLKTIVKGTINGFDYINNQYILTNNPKPIDSSKFYGIVKINNFKFYIPIKIFVRLEEHAYIGKKQKTTYKYINNDIITEGTTDINQDCAANTLLKYSNWFYVDNNQYLDLSNLSWNIHNSQIGEYQNIKLCIRYKFSLPSNIKIGNIINNTDFINSSLDLPNSENISSLNAVSPNLPLVNSVEIVNLYNNLNPSDKNIYLPQLTSALIPINELSCNIKTSTY